MLRLTAPEFPGSAERIDHRWRSGPLSRELPAKAIHETERPPPRHPLSDRSQSQQREGVNDREARSGMDLFDQSRWVFRGVNPTPAPGEPKSEALATAIDPETQSRTIRKVPSHHNPMASAGASAVGRGGANGPISQGAGCRFGDACDSIRVPIEGKTANRGDRRFLGYSVCSESIGWPHGWQ